MKRESVTQTLSGSFLQACIAKEIAAPLELRNDNRRLQNHTLPSFTVGGDAQVRRGISFPLLLESSKRRRLRQGEFWPLCRRRSQGGADVEVSNLDRAGN